MKSTAYLFAICLAVAMGFIWGRRERTSTIALSHVAAHVVARTPPVLSRPAARATSVLVQSEWQEYRQAHDKVLHENQALASEYKGLLDEAKAQEKALEAAMVKIDPKIAPIIAKLQELRQRNSVATK